MTSERTGGRVSGIPATCGVKWRHRQALPYPTVADVRAVSARISSSNRVARCGRPGRMESPHFWARLEQRLAAAAKAGRGLRYLSRDELDAVLRMLDGMKTPEVKPAARGGAR